MTTLPKDLDEALKMFDERFAPDLFDEKEQKQAMATYISASSYESMIKSFLTTVWHAGRQSVVEDIENWKYTYDNYPTMMESKKSFDRGSMARELAYELITKLSEIKK